MPATYHLQTRHWK